MDVLVLWVEDEPETVYYERRFAEALGWRITLVATAEGAKEEVTRRKFHLVVVDLIIAADQYNASRGKVEPGVGLEVVRWIREADSLRETPKDVPILVLTAIVSADTKRQVIEKLPSPELYLQKPVVTAVYEKTILNLNRKIVGPDQDPKGDHHAEG